MKKLWFIIFYLIVFCHYGQDTIYKRNGESVSVKVIEINVKEVSYKRMDLLDGPLMIVSKNEIKKIKYASGAIDSFTVFKEPVRMQIPLNLTPLYVETNSPLIKLSTRRGNYVYQKIRISDRKLLFLAGEKNLIWNSAEINDHIRASKTNRALQYTIGYAGGAIGVVGILSSLAALGNTSNSNDVFYSLVAASAAVGILVSSQVVSFSYKLKRVKHADKVMELYNQLSIK